MKKELMLAAVCLMASYSSLVLADDDSYHSESRYGQTFILHPASNLSRGNFYFMTAAGSRMGRYQQITPSVNIYDEGYSGPLVQAAFGYDRLIFDRFLLGVELFGSFSQAIHAERHYTAATYDWNHSIKTPLAYGLAIKPGYRLNNSDIFYLKPTYQVTQYKRQTEPSTSDTMGPNTQIHVGGVGIGIGYAKMLTPFSSLRFEINHINYGQTKAPTTNWEHNMKENNFVLGYSHHFHRFNTEPPRETAPTPHFGFYIGAGGGLSAFKGDILYTLATNNAKQYHLMNGQTGALGEVQIGYGNLFEKRTYLGIEAQAIYNTINSHETIGGNNTITLAEKQGGQLSFLPGYLMDNQSLILGQLGLTFTHFDRPAPVLTDTSAGPRGDQGPEFSKWSSGVILGLGYQSSITNNLSVRGLYSHHYHDRIRLPEYSTSGQVSKYYDWIMQSSHMAISVNYLIY